MDPSEKLILNVGLACLDIVMNVYSYPEEDSDERCESSQWKLGGNASNNSVLMRDFNIKCEYFGTLSSDYGGKYLKERLESHGILCSNCIFHNDCECPTTVCLINMKNGSRTLVHSNKNLPELRYEDFKKLDLSKYKWIHFEGRPTLDEILKMVDHINEWNKANFQSITISIELEKPKPNFLESIICPVDFVFISKDLAQMCNFNNMQSAVENLSQKLHPGSSLICPWGEQGACAMTSQGELVISPSFPPPKLVDTLAAGDTFVASVIISLSHGLSLQDSIINGCRVAGAKCGMYGIPGVHKMVDFL